MKKNRIKDLRDYIEKLHELNDLIYINCEVDPHLEIGAIARRSYEIEAPAQIYNNVKGASRGLRAMGGPAGLCSNKRYPAARVALSIGLPITATWPEIVRELSSARKSEPILPRIVETAPCKENILLGEDASLRDFPIPFLHIGDGGPYCNTWGTIVVRSPDGEKTNWSIARIQQLDNKTMSGLVMIPQHIGLIWEEWHKIGKPMPFALCQGCEPALPIVSSMPLVPYQDEADYLGGYFGEPIDVVRCETIDLEVPASSEIVIEGHMSVEREFNEGPFGEFAGYVATAKSLQPVYHIECITHRDQAIWPFVAEGRPTDEYHIAVGLGVSSELLHVLNEKSIPATMVWAPFEAATHWLIVAVDTNWRTKLDSNDSMELTKNIADIVWSTKVSGNYPIIYVLDDDIDITEPKDYMWAIATRCHPTKRMYVQQGEILPLLTCYTQNECAHAYGDKVAHDCLLPPPESREKHSSFKGAYPDELQEKILKNWNNYK